MANKTEVALAPAPESREVAIDGAIDGARPASLADAVCALMRDAKIALGGMQPDDVQIELSSHADQDRSSTHLKYRAYRRAPRDDAAKT
jgi:hypothetical protein